MTLAAAPDVVDVSLLVPAKDEAENLPEFMKLCQEALGKAPFSFEVVVVDDGSRDGTARCSPDLARQYPFLRVVTHRRQRGIADALRSAGAVARGDIFVFYPADLQYLPEDIPALVRPDPRGRGRHRDRHQAGQVREGVRLADLQRALPLAVRRPGHRSQFGEGLPAGDHGGTAAPPRLAPLHGGDRRGRRLSPDVAAGAAVPAARRHLEVHLDDAYRSGCSTCSRSGSSFASAASRCSSSA